LSEILQNVGDFGTHFFSLQFLVLFGAFIRSARIVTTVTDLFVEFGDSDPKDPDWIQILFRIGLKIRKSRFLKSGIRNNTNSRAFSGFKYTYEVSFAI
jgi:hypothetical protein